MRFSISYIRVMRLTILRAALPRILGAAAGAALCFFAPGLHAQTDPRTGPVVVQPGAPGQPTRVLPSSTRVTPPPASPKNVEFMQGMIMHHAQAVEMTDMIAASTANKDIRLLGERISKSQSDEMEFMKRWLEIRGESAAMHSALPNAHAHADPGHEHGTPEDVSESKQHLMPGMLTPKQMETLRRSKGREFDRLFLTGMIQHHNGALVMVKDLFDTAGAGQDAELFNFASDVDSGQRAEIRSMQTLLGERP
jgi:uncharacterized protein (DUF305 family)